MIHNHHQRRRRVRGAKRGLIIAQIGAVALFVLGFLIELTWVTASHVHRVVLGIFVAVAAAVLLVGVVNVLRERKGKVQGKR